ncbi:hypothetical protein CAPTEDRAFT_191400 [Capitella teleta]|uniref:Uncharacterized protein n=1 Tax=Capitella teleta TaxID=283909 RepID=R7T7M1_CAPTE|nr:hypothetical protein CAPTEDRAFT_191400 [Capitella teleta]|eukprot:ELT87004.1 hypothetical protein CAPTEDRAFT_191400 [Capitella teleta]
MASNIPNSTESEDTLGILTSLTGIPSYPAMVNLANRVATFGQSSWKGAADLTPGDLSDAGFFYTSGNESADKIMCFCGIHVNNWKPRDEPWTEHAKRNLHCSFVRQRRGDGFAQDVDSSESKPVDNVSA